MRRHLSLVLPSAHRLQSRYAAIRRRFFRPSSPRQIMYRLMGMACIVCLAATTPGRADDAAEARAIVEKAIKALGGADVLARHNAVVWKGAGSVTRDGEKHRVTSTWSVQGLDRYRWDAEADDGSGQKLLM